MNVSKMFLELFFSLLSTLGIKRLCWNIIDFWINIIYVIVLNSFSVCHKTHSLFASSSWQKMQNLYISDIKGVLISTFFSGSYQTFALSALSDRRRWWLLGNICSGNKSKNGEGMHLHLHMPYDIFGLCSHIIWFFGC